jgi:hypothetical protein
MIYANSQLSPAKLSDGLMSVTYTVYNRCVPNRKIESHAVESKIRSAMQNIEITSLSIHNHNVFWSAIIFVSLISENIK